MKKVTVKFLGKEPKVVNGTTWYPEEVWDIDTRILEAENLGGLVQVISPADAPSQEASYASQTATSTHEPGPEVVFNQSEAPAPAQRPVSIKKKG